MVITMEKTLCALSHPLSNRIVGPTGFEPMTNRL